MKTTSIQRLIPAAADSDKDKIGTYKQLTTISIPGGYDISWVDSGAAGITSPIAEMRLQNRQ